MKKELCVMEEKTKREICVENERKLRQKREWTKGKQTKTELGEGGEWTTAKNSPKKRTWSWYAVVFARVKVREEWTYLVSFLYRKWGVFFDPTRFMKPNPNWLAQLVFFTFLHQKLDQKSQKWWKRPRTRSQLGGVVVPRRIEQPYDPPLVCDYIGWEA